MRKLVLLKVLLEVAIMADMNSTADIRMTSTKMVKSFMDYKIMTFQMFTSVHKKTFDLMESYINSYYSESTVEAMNEQFFERFYSCFLPLHALTFSYNEVENLSREWACYCEYVCNQLGIELTKSLSVTAFSSHQNDLQRIYYLIKEVRKYGEIPVLCWEPFIVDIKCYRNLKSKQNALSKYVVFDQGYFVLQDKIGRNVIFFKQSPIKDYYKIKIDESVTAEMKIGDIVHMSMKRKIFCTAWNIINVKAYFDKSAGVYLNLGGNKV